MHYTGMAAVTFTRSSLPPDLSHAVPVSFIGIMALGSISIAVLGTVVVTSMFDRLHQHRELLLGTSEQLRALSASVSSAREEEGIRIARELHDELGSALTSLKWDLETIAGMFSEPLDYVKIGRLREQLAAMTRLVDSTIGVVRRIAADLRPRILDDFGLLDAIEWLTDQFQAQTGVTCRYERPPADVALTKEQSTAIFRILQQALTNIRRHAGASEVDVRVGIEGQAFVLRVSDNGRGITDEERLAPRSLGIVGMQERAALIDARFEVSGAPGRGTVVMVRMPLGVSTDV
jgi:two-component system sensor histidine kinase UhpB